VAIWNLLESQLCEDTTRAIMRRGNAQTSRGKWRLLEVALPRRAVKVTECKMRSAGELASMKRFVWIMALARRRYPGFVPNVFPCIEHVSSDQKISKYVSPIWILDNEGYAGLTSFFRSRKKAVTQRIVLHCASVFGA